MQVEARIPHVHAVESKRPVSYWSDIWPAIAAGALAAIVIFWKLGSGSLDDWDEAIYAQVAKEVVQTGDWLTLHWEYKPFFDKPPLLVWSTAILYSIFGVSEFWARAASALSGVGLIVVTFLTARSIYDRWVGLLAAAVLLASYQFIASARFGTTDMMLTLFIFCALYSYLRLRQGSQRWWLAIWISCALAVMTKSAAGFFAPAAIIAALVFEGQFVSTLRSKHFRVGLLLAFAIAAPWHILMLAEHGQAFTDQYIGHSILARSSSALEEHGGSRFYYVDRLGKYFFPWVYLAPFALALSLRENIRGRSRSLVLLIFAALVFVVCTLARTKLRWYILPVYPALSILVAAMIALAFRSHQSIAYSGLAMAAIIVALIAPLKIVLIFACAGFAVLLYWLAKRKAAYRAGAVVVVAFLMAAAANTIRPLYLNGETPLAKLARIAGSSEREPLIVYSGLYRPAALFYSNRPIKVAYTIDNLVAFTQSGQKEEIILSKKDAESLAGDYEISVMTEAEPYVYATINRRVGR
ncbi:MAG TPA: glycosyltransferase family 39 protein [Blastocatellia bacterium]|nr:glycosyltransferase family 39 protein [Blastocatellia bacterium]